MSTRRRLLVNEPMIGYAVPGRSAAQALTAGEIDALAISGAVDCGLGRQCEQDPLMHSIADYMALIETVYNGSGRRLLEVDVSRISNACATIAVGMSTMESGGCRAFIRQAQCCPDSGKSLGHYRWISIRSMSRSGFYAQSGSRSGERDALESSRLVVRGEPVTTVLALAKGF